MRITDESRSWVVYQMKIHGKPTGRSAVCEQREWEAMQRKQPGYHQLVRGGISSESEAEILARGTAGDTGKGQSRWQSASSPRRVTTASENA